ncbi:MAG: glycosyl hydrolase family 2 [Bacteroidales bacterium]|nr:glycosyl hydrolase family 2 [Bacteroidales bacterium]
MTIYANVLSKQPEDWPAETSVTKPGSRWWWMGSAVDEANLTKNLESYASAGMGSMEITPIYGVQGNDSAEVDFLSQKWMKLYNHTQKEAARLNLNIDMSTGTGWPFGGPSVSLQDAACKLITLEFQLKEGETLNKPIEVIDTKQQNARLLKLMAYPEKGKCLDLTALVTSQKLNWKAPEGNWRLIAAFSGNTFQKVKRPSAGGEGWVLNHFSQTAVSNYLNRFTKAFQESGATVPRAFFNDSYEVYEADWTPDLFEQFETRRGYKLEDYLPQFLSNQRTDTVARIVSDYRETLAELLLENFTRQWTGWANGLGSHTRNQAHGSPGNLIDLYAAVDIPECEGFGLSEFNIKGLRKDSLTRHNDSDLSMLKYASSAAHIAGKPYTSSETFTWLTEHFRTSFSQCKPDLDLMFTAGVNHIFFHGTTYSPAEVSWPAWKFYASVDMSPTNPLWHDAVPFFKYISRTQSFLQMGKPDNDFLIYLPVYDMWNDTKGRLLMFDIHKMAERAPGFIDVINKINGAGYDVDYVSDNFIRSASCLNNKIITLGKNAYKAIIIPGVKKMPADVLEKLIALARQGATIIFVSDYPSDVPGFGKLNDRRKTFRKQYKNLPEVTFNQTTITQVGKGKIITGKDYTSVLQATGIAAENMKSEFHLQSVRRSHPDGFHYFIAALKPTDTDEWITLGVPAQSAIFYDPLTGNKGKASLRQQQGKTQVQLQLASGASIILKTFTNQNIDLPDWKYIVSTGTPVDLNDDWTLTFVKSVPEIIDTFHLPELCPWTRINTLETRTNMGTARYSKRFMLTLGSESDWILDLDDVRETARVKINGVEVGTLWSVPYRISVGNYLKTGTNTMEIEVTGLPANRIAEMDRQGIPWRRFKDINIVDIHYKKTGYQHWGIMPAGLNGTVKLIPVQY